MVGIWHVKQVWIFLIWDSTLLVGSRPPPPEENGVLVQRYSLTSGATVLECNAADDAIASPRDIESDTDPFHPKDPVHL
jgi:hypothetical protein